MGDRSRGPLRLPGAAAAPDLLGSSVGARRSEFPKFTFVHSARNGIPARDVTYAEQLGEPS